MLTLLLSLKLVLDVLFKLLSLQTNLKDLSLAVVRRLVVVAGVFFSSEMWYHLEGLAE
jgi:hypothetical protein